MVAKFYCKNYVFYAHVWSALISSLNALHHLIKIVLVLGVKTEQIISDQPTDRRLTEGKNGLGRIVDAYDHGYS
jgi:hypothetical protein